jgi:hypothetical protein
MQLTLSELKIPLSGAACALVAGLLAGGAMQPHLDDGDRPSGPQMFADWAGARSTGPFDSSTTFVSYQGKMPDYVLGTDWKRSMTWSDERAAVSPPREIVRDEAPPPPMESASLTRAAYEEPPAPAHAYPSLYGGQAPAPADEPTAEDAAPAITG